MKVLDIADFFSERGGGVRSYLGTLAAEGTARSHDVVVVAPGPRNETSDFRGGRVIRLAGPAMPYDNSYHLLWRVDRVLEIVRRERPDVVQASSPYLPAVVVRGLRDVPIRSLVYHSDQIATYIHPLLERLAPPSLKVRLARVVDAWPRRLANGFDITITPSETIRANLVAAGCKNVRCVPFGVQVESFGPQHASDTLRRAMLGGFADRSGAAVAIVAGRLAVEKRVDRIIDALRLVNERRPVALVVLGDGPERKRLEARARSLSNVMFRGFVKNRDEYRTLLASADVFVHAGAAETFGFVLAEALASGLGLVVPSAGAAQEYAVPGVSETYPAYGRLEDMASAIERVIDTPRETRRTAFVTAKLPLRSQAAHFDELFALYASMLKRKTLGSALADRPEQSSLQAAE